MLIDADRQSAKAAFGADDSQVERDLAHQTRLTMTAAQSRVEVVRAWAALARHGGTTG